MKLALSGFITLDGVSQSPGSPTEGTSDGFTGGGRLVWLCTSRPGGDSARASGTGPGQDPAMRALLRNDGVGESVSWPMENGTELSRRSSRVLPHRPDEVCLVSEP